MVIERTAQNGFIDFLKNLENKKDIYIVDLESDNLKYHEVLEDLFKENYINIGYSHDLGIGIAAGLIHQNKQVFLCGEVNKVMGVSKNLLDQFVAIHNLNLKIIGYEKEIDFVTSGNFQELSDIGFFSRIENFTVLAPIDYYETQACMNELMDLHGPAYIRLSSKEGVKIYENASKDFFSLGFFDTIWKGDGRVIISYGDGVSFALSVSQGLHKENINVSVFNMSTITPLDRGLIEELVNKYQKVVFLEPHSNLSGIGDLFAKELCINHFSGDLLCLGINDINKHEGIEKRITSFLN
jgi:transketolase